MRRGDPTGSKGSKDRIRREVVTAGTPFFVQTEVRAMTFRKRKATADAATAPKEWQKVLGRPKEGKIEMLEM